MIILIFLGIVFYVLSVLFCRKQIIKDSEQLSVNMLDSFDMFVCLIPFLNLGVGIMLTMSRIKIPKIDIIVSMFFNKGGRK